MHTNHSIHITRRRQGLVARQKCRIQTVMFITALLLTFGTAWHMITVIEAKLTPPVGIVSQQLARVGE